MTNKPLSVVVSVLLKEGKILLIKRIRGDYVGLWGLPGGKIEKDEHLFEAARREILEETGIETDFKNYLGLVSEHLIEDNEILQHFLLHICELEPRSFDVKSSSEGESSWFDVDKIEERKNEIIPSDFLIIEKIIKNREKNYYSCVLEKKGERYFLKKFE